MWQDFKMMVENALKGVLSVCPEGMTMIWLGFYIAAAGLALALILAFIGLGGWNVMDVFIFGLLFAGFSAFFFRDPERNHAFAPDEIVCPADGRVMTIGTESDPNVLVIRIFLSVFDVHIQRSTLDATVGEITYNKGKFEVAYKPEAVNNERNLIRLSNGDRFAHVEQITGAIARRISCWVKPGQTVKAGDKIGLIYFGSQVAIYLPKDKVRVLARVGQKVEGAQTVIGLWK